MRKKILIGLFLLFSILSFSQINDNLGVFTQEEIKNIQDRMKEISEKNEIDLYLNTDFYGSSSQLKVLEKSVIIDMVKEDEEHLNVKISFTQDIDVTPYQEELENMLGNLSNIIAEGENEKYTLELLNNLDDTFSRMEADKESQEEKLKNDKVLNKKVIFFIILILIAYSYKKNSIKRLFLKIKKR